MQEKTLSRSWIALAGLAALAAAPLEQKLRDSDHKKLGKQIASYYEAKEEKKGIEEAFLKVVKDMDKSQKRLRDVPLLSAVEDLERALWYAQQATYKGRHKGGKVISASLAGYGDDVPLGYHLPSKYSTRGDPYALILCVPDAGETPEGHLEGQWNDPGLREAALLVAVDMPSETAEWGNFIADPSAGSGVWAVMNTYSVAKQQFAVDMNRVYLAGTGKGFAAAAATAACFPHLFAGVIGRGEVPEMAATNFRSIPSLLLSPSEGAKAIEKAVGELGFGNCTVNPEGGLAEILAFVSERSRESYPSEIQFSPFSNITSGTPWVQIEGFQVDPEKPADEQPSISAKADRDANTITIDAKGIASLTIYLNDLLVDMDKPVKLVVNGVAQEETVTRNQRMVLDHAFASGDWGRVFTARLDIDVRGE